jgi:DAK2 domain fusion protein YloV
MNLEAIETLITNDIFDQMVQASADRLKMNADFINSLNVFPVPDGDTGTNMSLSLESGAKYEADDASTEVGHLAASLAKGLLMGARGNSGVILSQIFRGFAKSVENKSTLTANDLAEAVADGAKTAYKAVMKPTEGTILTVVREAAKAGKEAVKTSDNLAEVMQAIDTAAQAALKKTTELLPVLKEVGVVDSGGQGLVFVFDAFNDILNGNDVSEYKFVPDNNEINEMVDANHQQQSVQGQINPEDIEFGYCTQMMVRIGKGRQVSKDFDYDTFYEYLAGMGDSLLVINDDEVVKVHVHTEHPGDVLSWGQKFGDITKIKVDNMRWQQEEIMEQDEVPATPVEEEKEAPETAVIAISSGTGISKLFNSLGVTHIISGGQTMNPSTADIAAMINNSGAKQAIVLPNNKNIFLAAEQAVEVADIPTKIIHSRTISQGMAAMLEFNPDAELEENAEAMEDNLDTVKSGQVTVAVRDTKLDGREIRKDDYMGLIDGKIVNTNPDLMDASVEMVNLMLEEDSEIVTIIYGQDGSQAMAEELQNAILDIDDDLEVEIHEGNQPVYPFLISVE